MKKESIFKFLLKVVVSNIAVYLLYTLVVGLLNIFTGGSLAVLSGLHEMNGWTPDDVSPFLRVFIPIMLVVICVVCFFLFYVLMLFIKTKFGGHREDFLHEIGSEHFDINEYSKKRMAKKGNGRREFIAFSIFIAVCSIPSLFGFGFLSILIIPQTMFATSILAFIPIAGTVKSLVSLILTLVFSIGSFYLYETLVLPRLYGKWASERLHVE